MCEPKVVESERAFTEVLDNIACCLMQGDGELLHATHLDVESPLQDGSEEGDCVVCFSQCLILSVFD